MSIEWELPNIGEGIEEADVAEILVKEGDRVDANQALMELETEKAVVELPAPAAGVVEKLLVKSGDTIKVGQPYMVVADAAGTAHSDEAAKPAPQETSATTESEPPQEKPASAEAKPTDAAPAASTTSSKTEMVTGTVEFKLPPLGEGVESADIAEIVVSEGDVVNVGDPLMELETEKAVVELPSEHAGKIVKIHVSEGESVSVGAVVITFEASTPVGSQSSSAGGEKPAATATSSASQASSAKTSAAKSASVATSAAAESNASSPSQDSAKASTNGARSESGDSGSNNLPVPAAPSTRRLARELGVDLREIKGSGSGGRISQEDVQAYVRSRLQGTSLSKTSAPRGELTLAAGSLAPPPLPDFSKYGVIEREKMNKLARTAAENLTVSWNVIPHVTQHDRADITDLEAARKRFSSGIGKNGPKVTMTAIVIKALTTCLQGYPKFNSSLDPETNEIVYKKYYNIGCAVDTENGLVVPVIKNCDQKSILQIASEVTDLAMKARDRKLSIDDMQGATCTVTNLGGIGGVGFTPIVNYPEVCILGMSRGQQELQMIDGQIEQRLMLPLSLSYDHRVVNGADAARFLVAFSNLLSDPFQLLTTV